MVTTRTTTASELLAPGSNAPFELIQGELVSVSLSTPKSNLVMGNIYSELRQFVRKHKLGFVFVAEAGFRVESNPDTVVAPDVAFVARDRIPDPLPERGFPSVVPNLIVEVLSPTDEPEDSKRKQAIDERVGVPLVWWIDPSKETATVHVPRCTHWERCRVSSMEVRYSMARQPSQDSRCRWSRHSRNPDQSSPRDSNGRGAFRATRIIPTARNGNNSNARWNEPVASLTTPPTTGPIADAR